MDTLALSADTRALDVGCGCGQPACRSLGEWPRRRCNRGRYPTDAGTGRLANQESADSAWSSSSRQMLRSMPLNPIPLTWSSHDSASCFEDPVAAFTNIRGGDVFAGNTGFLLLATAGSQSVCDGARNGRPGASAAGRGVTQITRASSP